MRAQYFVSCIFFLFSAQVGSPEIQEHAPTVDVCRADVAVWFNAHDATEYTDAERIYITDRVTNSTTIAKLPIKEVGLRMGELGECAFVDKTNANRYWEARDFYTGVLCDRHMNFLRRHHLMQQVADEDAQGIR